MNYVILAAGLGSRFINEGESDPKPMVKILGQPMIGRLIDILLECGGKRINIVTNSRMPQLNEYLSRRRDAEGLPLDIRPIVSDNSYYSLTEGTRGLEGKFVAMTVDAIFPTSEFRKYVEACELATDDTALMALTKFVDDESPLYARLGNDGNEVVDYRYGGKPFDEGVIVSAGMYGLSDTIMDTVAARAGYPESLSDFQRILAAESPIRVVPYEFSKAFDVDCGHDRILAELFVQEVNGETTYHNSDL